MNHTYEKELMENLSKKEFREIVKQAKYKNIKNHDALHNFVLELSPEIRDKITGAYFEALMETLKISRF